MTTHFLFAGPVFGEKKWFLARTRSDAPEVVHYDSKALLHAAIRQTLSKLLSENSKVEMTTLEGTCVDAASYSVRNGEIRRIGVVPDEQMIFQVQVFRGSPLQDVTIGAPSKKGSSRKKAEKSPKAATTSKTSKSAKTSKTKPAKVQKAQKTASVPATAVGSTAGMLPRLDQLGSGATSKSAKAAKSSKSAKAPAASSSKNATAPRTATKKAKGTNKDGTPRKPNRYSEFVKKWIGAHPGVPFAEAQPQIKAAYDARGRK